MARHLAGILKELSSEKRPFFDAFFQIETLREASIDDSRFGKEVHSQRFKKRLGKRWKEGLGRTDGCRRKAADFKIGAG